MNENSRVSGTGPHQRFLSCAMKFTQTQTIMHDFPYVFTYYVFLCNSICGQNRFTKPFHDKFEFYLVTSHMNNDLKCG